MRLDSVGLGLLPRSARSGLGKKNETQAEENAKFTFFSVEELLVCAGRLSAPTRCGAAAGAALRLLER